MLVKITSDKRKNLVHYIQYYEPSQRVIKIASTSVKFMILWSDDVVEYLAPDKNGAEDDLETIEEVVADDDNSGASRRPTFTRTDRLDGRRHWRQKTCIWQIHISVSRRITRDVVVDVVIIIIITVVV